MTDPSAEEMLSNAGAGALTSDASHDDVREWLKAVDEAMKSTGSAQRQLVRDAVVAQLQSVEAVSAPARLADAFLDGDSAGDPADGLQGSALALEDPELWPEPVNGAELLVELAETFTTYLSLPAGAASAIALWTVHAHAHDAFPVSPVLAVTSPEKRCGKTTLLELLSALVPRPLPASNVTAATVFRAVERWRPTLLVDEADTFLHDGSPQLRGVLNSGHRRSLAHVVRTVGDDYEPRQFRTWSPKAVALIGQLPGTLQDRSLEIRMRRLAPDEEIERLRLDQLDRLEPLRRQAWTWASRRMDQLAARDPSVPETLHDRERDNWRPLLAIADVAGGPWPERARESARAIQESERDDRSLGTRLLADVQKILDGQPSDRIRSKKLVAKLCALEEAPWAQYKGKGLSPVSLANFLRSFDVSSKQLRFEAGSYKGYEAEAFEDAFRRYLDTPSPEPFDEGETPKQSQNNRDSDGSGAETSVPPVSGQEPSECPDETGNVSGVSGRQGSPGEEEGRAGETNTCQTCGRPIGPTAEVCGRCKSEAQVEDRC